MAEKEQVDNLIFIYDANSGKMGAFFDSTKKLLMIRGCALCSITHGIFGEKNEWKDCKEVLGVSITYYHKDEIPDHLKEIAANNLPCILARVEETFLMLLTGDVLNRCQGDVDDLKGRMDFHLSANNLEL